MIDPFIRTLLTSSQVPFNKNETPQFLGISYLQKIAKVYFDTSKNINISMIRENLAKLSLVSSLLLDQYLGDKDIATAFLISEAAEIAVDVDTISKEDLSVSLASITHLLDIASFFHLADFDANASVIAEKALIALSQELFNHQNQISFSMIKYYKMLSDFLRGRFGDLLNENNERVVALSTQDRVFIRLSDFLVELTNYYRGLEDISDKSTSDLFTLSEITSSSGLYSVSSPELIRLLSFAKVAKRKALYPLLAKKLIEQKSYLDKRISGIANGSYPFAWPPVRMFCEKYLGGKSHHAVITLPTGSGKSFLAELAIVEAIQKGWVLYLAPTNALCAQIRNDLKNNLATINNSEIDLFIGGFEYIPDLVDLKSALNYIAVMTPEKASLLLKLYPEKAKNCSLTILDECHVLSDSGRGSITEFVLSSMLSASPDIHLLFMSALLKNPEKLSNWLAYKTGKTATIIQNDWRPTRSARIILTQDWENIRSAKEGNRTKYYLPVVAVSDAYTPWTSDNNHYYAWPTNLYIESNNPHKFNASKNILAKDLAISFAVKKLQTLVIIFSSKHHVFSIAENITNLPDNTIMQSQAEFDWLKIANYELGVPSKLEKIISENHVSVHSTIMLQSERKASEDAYNLGRTRIMISTTTLAQGLNLNSQVVILSGTEFYNDSNEQDEKDLLDIKDRSVQQVLNGCGRAARANIATRGFSVIIPSLNIPFSRGNVKKTIIDTLPIVSYNENITNVTSKIQELLTQVNISDQDSLPNSSELKLALFLPTNRREAEILLNNSLASLEINSDRQRNILDRLDKVKLLLIRGNIPEWLLQVAYLSNTDIQFIIELRTYLLTLGEDYYPMSYNDLSLLLLDWLEKCNPHLTWDFLLSHVKNWYWYWGSEKDPPFAAQVKEDKSILDNSHGQLKDLWQNLKECIGLWLNDGTYLEIGNTLVRGKCEEKKFTERSHPGYPIPRAIAWTQNTMDELSVFAGALSALRDIWEKSDKENLPKWLANSRLIQTLPMAIRFGVSNPTSLTWYRFLISERRSANLLSKLVPFTIENPLDESEVKEFISKAKNFLYNNKKLTQSNELISIIKRISK